MKIKRILEVWEKGMDGAPLGSIELADDVPTEFLFSLFCNEQDRPDPDMQLAYLLDAPRVAQLQRWCSTPLEADRFDYILSAYGLPDLPQSPQ
ncbi:hypothetical protein [Chitinilyticum piscinae]|uniref:Uncharacterized protein n=1 Tax=Chitinilyticum piscinae TaxID=2866724 RepID=A0A8J7K1H3_9NEIS|nr:hypothetical protein [Chitinilyticum piscinae]MBE9609206.1 hypothetical protein [Chitinilyticum piscinae]